MDITEVRIKLMVDSDDRLQAFCSITFDDCFVVRDLKIIEGSNGPFVAMPSRKLTSHCSNCGMKNHLRANYCNQCGSRAKDERGGRDQSGRTKLYADIAHPINSSCREMIQECVIQEYRDELTRSQEPDYVSRYDDDYDDYISDDFVPQSVTGAAESKSEQTTSQVKPKNPKPASQTDVAKKEAPVKQGIVEMQPDQPQPRGPHSPQSANPATGGKSRERGAESTSDEKIGQSAAPSPPSADPTQNEDGSFGAGIFE